MTGQATFALVAASPPRPDNKDCRVQLRRRETFDEEIAAVARAVLPLALSLCDSREEAEDVLAEAVGRCLDRWQSGRIAYPRAYLRTAVINEVRQRHRSRTRLIPLRNDEHETAAAPETDRVDDHLTVRAALHELPERQRLAVALRYLEDLPYEAIADVMGITVGTAKSQVSRGVARLGTNLGISQPEEVCDGRA
jgi:RNA polymerase sigma factor (sigma-70 family)